MIDPEIERELANIRDQFKRELSSYGELINVRNEARVEALKIALASNDKRLDLMNEIRGALTDQGARMVSRDESASANEVIEQRVEQNRVAIESRLEVVTKPLEERIEQTRVSMEARIEAITRPKWSLMTALFSICLGLIGGAWVLTGLKFEAAVAPIALLSEQVKVQVTGDAERLRILETASVGSLQADATSKIDRAQLNDRLHQSETLAGNNLAERRAQQAAMAAKLVEIETQFCASDIVRNSIHAYDQRFFAMLWAKAYPGEKYPTDNAYYPRVCNRVPGAGE
jgi:hypothetical protein